MKKKHIVKNTRDFENIINTGRCIKNKYFVIHHKPNDIPYDRFGISVSKKLGNAVFRNRYKRIIRSIVDNYKKIYINNEDYIIILRRDAIDKTYNLLKEELFALLNTSKKGIQQKNDKKIEKN